MRVSAVKLDTVHGSYIVDVDSVAVCDSQGSVCGVNGGISIRRSVTTATGCTVTVCDICVGIYLSSV